MDILSHRPHESNVACVSLLGNENGDETLGNPVLNILLLLLLLLLVGGSIVVSDKKGKREREEREGGRGGGKTK